MFSELQPSTELIVYIVCYRELNPDVFMSLHFDLLFCYSCNERLTLAESTSYSLSYQEGWQGILRDTGYQWVRI